MKQKPARPFVPVERHETIRREIIAFITGAPRSAREISAQIHISEKEAYDHLEHIRLTLERSVNALIVIPAECSGCGFVFRKRARLHKPGKCPVCRHESILEPLFSIGEEK